MEGKRNKNIGEKLSKKELWGSRLWPEFKLRMRGEFKSGFPLSFLILKGIAMGDSTFVGTLARSKIFKRQLETGRSKILRF